MHPRSTNLQRIHFNVMDHRQVRLNPQRGTVTRVGGGDAANRRRQSTGQITYICRQTRRHINPVRRTLLERETANHMHEVRQPQLNTVRRRANALVTIVSNIDRRRVGAGPDLIARQFQFAITVQIRRR